MSAISINNVSFGFAKNRTIIHDIDAEIPFGKIYSLLGPSGAGKTTLLRLVLGRIKPNAGSISVLGEAPGKNNRTIGYMPQDVALCMSFSVAQTLQYFAHIYRLSAKKFDKRKAMLTEVLGISPQDEKSVRELSGGQQKMVSLALAFLHNPRLLILDEPTVGSDPILGDIIWNYLHRCCSESISIVIVTHYIEEAARGHVVGIMRDGSMMDEGSPPDLLAKYDRATLEDVFLHICTVGAISRKHAEEQPKAEQVVVVETQKNKQDKIARKRITPFGANILLNMWILSVLVRKNLQRFFGFNLSFLVFLIPAFQVLILCTLYNRDAIPVNTAVFNEDRDPYYSTQLLNSIEKVDVYYLNPIYYDSLDEALNAVTDAKAIGAIWLARNYSDSLSARFDAPEDVDRGTLMSSNVRMFVDNVNYIFANGLLDSMRQTVFRFLSVISRERNQTSLESPIDLREIIYAKGSKLSDFLLPGYIISFMYLSQVSLSSQLLIQEKCDGLFERSLIAGVGHRLVFYSHFLSSCVLSVVQIVLILIVSLAIFDITNFGSFELIFVLVFAQAINAIATGLLISSIFSEGFVAILAAIFVTFSQLFSSGAIFPMELVRSSLRDYFYALPIALPSESMRNVMLRGWSITHPNVYNGLLMNIGFGFVFLLLAAMIFRRFS